MDEIPDCEWVFYIEALDSKFCQKKNLKGEKIRVSSFDYQPSGLTCNGFIPLVDNSNRD